MGGVSGSSHTRPARAFAFHRCVLRVAGGPCTKAAWARKAIGPCGEILAGASKMGTLLEGLSGYSLALRESRSESASLQSAFKIVVAELDDQIRDCDATVTGVDLPKVNVSLERLMQLLREPDRQLAALPLGSARR